MPLSREEVVTWLEGFKYVCYSSVWECHEDAQYRIDAALKELKKMMTPADLEEAHSLLKRHRWIQNVLNNMEDDDSESPIEIKICGQRHTGDRDLYNEIECAVLKYYNDLKRGVEVRLADLGVAV